MKLRKLMTALALAAGLTTAATAVTPVVTWDGDLANNSVKNGFTMTFGANAAESSGSAVFTAKTSGSGNTGVAIDWDGETFSGQTMTVLVRFSGMKQSGFTGNTALVGTYWDSSDKSTETLVNANGSQLKMAYNVTSSNSGNNGTYWTRSAPEAGLMRVTFSSSGTHLTISTGSDGAWTTKSIDLTGTDSNLKKSASFYGLKIGGSIAGMGSYYRPGMTVSAVSILDSDITDDELTAFMFTNEKRTYKSVLSLNFGASTYNVSSGATPVAIVDDDNWYNFNAGKSGTGTAGDVTVTYGGSGNYQNTGKAPVYLKGYLDDNGSTVGITVTNLTGVAYDVLIYCNSDNASGWSYKTVNGKDYYALTSGEAAVGNSTWGNNTATISKLGSNVMLVHGITPDTDGTITISSVRNGGYRGCIAAIQLGELENVVVKDFALTLDDNAAWQSANWDPEIPEEGMPIDATATVTVDAASPTLTLDGEITVGTLKVVSETGKMLVVKKDPAATTSFSTLDVSEATDGTAWDGRENTFTACNALLTAARTVDNKFYFYGNGDNGSVLDYGTAATHYTFSGHYIFDGGVHTFQHNSDSQKLLFGANATVENPTFWVKDNTVLNWKARNPCGWNATASDAGIVRIGNGATVKPLNADANAGTWYWSQQFYLDNGATLEIGTTGDYFRTVGNDSTKPHFFVPENAEATIAGGESNYLALPANDGGAAVFSVGEDSTLTVSANLKTLANGKPFVKYGAGTLKLTGDVANFAAAIQVKAGTLTIDNWATLNNNATIAIDEGATYRITAAEDATLSKTITGTGAVVKDGAGTLSVTPGQFGDNLVTIEGGSLKFTLTHEQAKAGVVLCQTEAETIKASIVIVNEAGEELSGDFTKEGNALSFKANCSDVYITVDSSGLDWGDVREELGWIDSPESTLVITNDSPETADAWLDFSAGIVAKSIKIVHVDEGADTYIGSDSFAYMTVGSYDFTEAPDVFIDFFDSVTREMQLVTGTPIDGVENVKAANIGSKTEEFGLYTDATHIWLCRKIDDVTRVSPVTGEVQAFTNFFVGVNYGYGWIADWADKSNWRTAKDGLLAPYQYEKYPQSSEAQNSNWYPACFDGDLIDKYYGYKDITCETVEGWATKLDFRNGVNVKIGRQKKFANQFMWIDKTSSVTIDKVGGSTTQYGFVFDVAGQLTIGEIEQNQPITFTYNLGENATVTYTNGIKYGTHALNGGKLIAEGAGISVPVTVTNDVTIATPAVGKITIAPESTLTLESTAEDVLVIGDFTNNGTIEVSAGTVVFKPGVTTGTVQTSGTGMVFYGFTVDINDCGKFTPPEGYTVDNIRLFDAGGNMIASTIVGDHLEYEWDVAGKNCWWDYGFNGNLTSVGTDTTTMSDERPKGVDDPYNEDETALRVGYGTPYRGASYPENFTAVIYGKMVNNNGHMEIGFGSTTSGTRYGVVIACGDPAKNEVNLHITSEYDIMTTVPMTVTDPYDTDHLYAFTCQTVDEKTKVSVYLDGKFLQAYTFGSKITLGSGFQVGSIHGGSLSGCTKATTANDHADLDFLRVYQTVLTAEAMTKYAEKYPYTSKGGSSVRTFDDALDQTWVAAEADKVWTVTPFEETAYTTNIALAGSTVTVSASATAEVTMNLTEATTYESLTIGEGSDITITTGDEAVEPTITGVTTIKANVTVDYDAIKIGTVEVAAEKTLTFDFTDFPFTNYFASATIAYTGATSGEGTITATGLPTEGVRTVTFEKNASTDQYELKIMVDVATPFIFTIGATEEEGTWTFGETEPVTQEIVDANPKAAIWKKGDGSWTNVVLNRTYFVKEGTMVAGNAVGLTGAVTVDGMTTFDFNGKIDGYITVNLNGGTFVNNGGAMGSGNRQLNGIALTEDSTIGGTGNFGLVSGGYGANTLDLGGKTLTKIDNNTFWLCHTTVTNGTLNVTAGTIQVVNYETTFTDDAKLVLSQGTTLNVGDKLNIAAITADGATINNTYATKPLAFTLTGSATLTGNGNWGTNTLAKAAVANIGTKRGLTFAGAGTVYVTLTADEFNATTGDRELFTMADGATTAIKVFYNDADITGKCTFSGGTLKSIDHAATIGTQYYLTLAEALDAAQADETVTLLKTVAVASLTVPEDVTLDLNNFQVQTTAVVNNGTIVVYDLATATALKDLDGTLKAGVDLDGKPAMFYPQGTTVSHSTEVVESTEHTNNVPTLEVTVPETKTVIWAQGVGPYNKMYVYGDAEFAGDINGGWDTNKLMTVFGVGGALKLNSDINIGKFASATAYGTLDMNGKAFILSDTDAILTTITNLVVGTDVTTDKAGYEVRVAESEGYYYYTIAEKPKGTVLLISGTTTNDYETIAAALEKATAGDTIMLTADQTLDATLAIDKAITLDLGNKVVTLPSGFVDGVKVTAAATIQNGTLDSQLASFADSPNARAYALHSYKTSAVYSNLVVNAVNYRFAVYAEGADTIAACYGENDPTTTVNCYNVDVTGNSVFFEVEFTKMNLDADCSGVLKDGEAAVGDYKAAIYSAGNATVTIAGGAYTNTLALLSGNLGGTIVVNGGDFNGQVYSWMQTTASHYATYKDDPKYWAYFTLNAGTFTGPIAFKDESEAARDLDSFSKLIKVALDAPEGYEWKNNGSAQYYNLKKKSDTPSIPESQGAIVPVEGKENTYAVSNTTDTVYISNLPANATVVLDPSVTHISGMSDTTTIKIVAESTNTTETVVDITGAFKVVKGTGETATIALNPAGSVTVEGDTIPVVPEVKADAAKPIDPAASAETATVAGHTIPGLTYQLTRCENLGAAEPQYTAVGDAIKAKGTTTTLTDPSKPASQAFYKIKVTK